MTTPDSWLHPQCEEPGNQRALSDSIAQDIGGLALERASSSDRADIHDRPRSSPCSDCSNAESGGFPPLETKFSLLATRETPSLQSSRAIALIYICIAVEDVYEPFLQEATDWTPIVSCLAHEDFYKSLLQREATDWSRAVYSWDLSQMDCFRDMQPSDWQVQLGSLALILIDFYNGRKPSGYSLSQNFSAVQNRALCGMIFGLEFNKLSPRGPADMANHSRELSNFALFNQQPPLDATSLKERMHDLRQHLLIDPPAHGVSEGRPRVNQSLIGTSRF